MYSHRTVCLSWLRSHFLCVFFALILTTRVSAESASPSVELDLAALEQTTFQEQAQDHEKAAHLLAIEAAHAQELTISTASQEIRHTQEMQESISAEQRARCALVHVVARLGYLIYPS